MAASETLPDTGAPLAPAEPEAEAREADSAADLAGAVAVDAVVGTVTAAAGASAPDVVPLDASLPPVGTAALGAAGPCGGLRACAGAGALQTRIAKQRETDTDSGAQVGRARTTWSAANGLQSGAHVRQTLGHKRAGPSVPHHCGRWMDDRT